MLVLSRRVGEKIVLPGLNVAVRMVAVLREHGPQPDSPRGQRPQASFLAVQGAASAA